jgi:adenylate cyclase
VIDLSTRDTLWAKTYDGRLSATDLFAFEDTVTNEVAATLADDFGVIHRSLAPQALDKATDNLQVFDAMLRYHHYFVVLTDEMWTAAHAALERAVEADPSYAPTHAMLADLQGTQYHLAGAGEESLQRMEDLVARALKLEPQNERAHQMKAMTHLFRGRRDLFIAEAEWVTRHSPNNSNALASMGLFLAIVGEWERGLALTEKAMRLNPHYPGWLHFGPFLNLYRRGAYQEALREAMRINTAGFYLDPLARAATLGQLGRAAEAASALEEMQRLLPDNGIELREFMRRTLFSDENVAMLMEGLVKAGWEDREA